MKQTVTVNSKLDEERSELTFDTFIAMESEISQTIQNHFKEIVNFKEKTMKQALIKLGWTPPQDNT